jgi:sulfite exporter TauE/SafE/copper chaperone CopZ
MDTDIKNAKLRISGMTCVNCQNRIERKLNKLDGISIVHVSYSKGTADIEYDAGIISLETIDGEIDKLGYKVVAGSKPGGSLRIVGLLVIIAAAYVLLEHFGILNRLAPSMLAEKGMSYAALFVIGVVTSVHCLAMCGGIALSQCIPKSAQDDGTSPIRPALLYNVGRVISYTVVGFIVGAVGSAFTMSNTLQGILKLIAGIFMIIMGLSMIGAFSWLRVLVPRMPRVFAIKINKGKTKSSSPLIVGLLNGLMPCGPLQAMQLFALSTGSPVSGALSMLVFSLGTVPLMLGFGTISSALGKKFTSRVMTVGAVLVAVLGLSMFTQGVTLFEAGIIRAAPQPSVSQSQSGIAVSDGDVQVIQSTLNSGSYPNITVKVGMPVRWEFDAPQGSISGCNRSLYIPEYQLEHTFQTGENIIEFTPTRTGTFRYSCWMGMIRATITVTE